MRTSLILKKLSVKTGLNLPKESESASKANFFISISCAFCLFYYYITYYLLSINQLLRIWILQTNNAPRWSNKTKGASNSSHAPIVSPLLTWFFFQSVCLVRYVAIKLLPFCRHDFQFFNTQRLSELYEKEVRYLMVCILYRLLCFCSCLSLGVGLRYFILIYPFIEISANTSEESNKGLNWCWWTWRYYSFSHMMCLVVFPVFFSS